jgi:hypothetical protein
MTLEEKFKDVIEDAITHDQQYDSFEQIAEDFAIGFAEWCKQEYDVENTPFHNKWLNVDGEYVSTKELLEIYKETL